MKYALVLTAVLLAGCPDEEEFNPAGSYDVLYTPADDACGLDAYANVVSILDEGDGVYTLDVSDSSERFGDSSLSCDATNCTVLFVTSDFETLVQRNYRLVVTDDFLVQGTLTASTSLCSQIFAAVGQRR